MTLSAELHINCESVDRRGGTARIFNIQRYSLNDGEGIRTVVFFKGCPHTCPWCANPESMSPDVDIVYREIKCIHCSGCSMDVHKCPSGAMEQIGRDITHVELEKEVLKDDVFFRVSGGGVTLSGGEVLMQARFATLFLRRLRAQGINTAIETAGDTHPRRLLRLAKACDAVLFDLKIMDKNAARKILNINLERVLSNLTMLVANGVNVIPRLPLIPGYTLNQENFMKALNVARSLNLKEIHLLPYHPYGEPKYRLLNKTWTMGAALPPTRTDVDALKIIAQKAGFNVKIGG